MTSDRIRSPGGSTGPPGDTPLPRAVPGPFPLGTSRVQTARLGARVLESGATLPDLEVAYRHDGRAPGAPQVLLVHALTGSADAAGDWWAPLVGPGLGLDTDHVGVLCANLVGGRYGSTGPTSMNPVTGEPYGRAFPAVTARDQASVLWALADALGIGAFSLVTGGSLGGMVALEVALARPDRVGHVLPMAAPAATGPMALAWNHLQVRLIDRLGVEGMALARQLAMTTYRSEDDFEARFGREREADDRFSVVSYLEHQGRKLVERFDPETYRVLVGTMNGHDIGRDRGGIDVALRALARAGTRLTGVGIEGDILYGPGQVQALVEAATRAGVDARYRDLRSTKGHDAFLVEWEQLATLLAGALAPAIGARAGAA
jgi:homoserine O-acetyltransferase/O-succinyltransferase